MPKLSFIVSTCDRPSVLPIVLHSLAVQTRANFEVIVTDNSSAENRHHNRRTIDALRDSRFRHVDTASLELGGCYHTAEWAVANECGGEYLCFPSDDSYYVPCFAEVMLEAAEQNGWDLVYCNMVYDARFNGQHYSVINVQPRINSIDKTGFIMKRNWFFGFPGKTKSGNCKADGELIESLLDNGISHGKVPGVLLVHN